MRLLVLSDIHGAAPKVERIMAGRPDVDLVIIAGDLTQWGGAEQAAEIIAPIIQSGIRLLAVPGNMDTRGVLDYLQENKINMHGQGVVIDRSGFFGLGGSNHTPFHSPFEQSEQEIEQVLGKGLAEVRDCEPIILISHVPPFNTPLDRTFMGVHCGSQAVKDFILSAAPALCISGHVHESAGQDTLGNTVCVNVGAVKNNEYCIIELLQGKTTITRRKIS